MMLLCVLILAQLGLITSELETVSHAAHQPHHPVPDEHYIGGQHNPDFDHDSIIGSRQVHEQFEHLLPEEAKKRLGVMVDQMDTNQDGSVTKLELTNWITQSFIQLDQEEADLKMPDYDKNKDGKLTWEEYLSSVYGYKPGDLHEMEKDTNPDIVAFYTMVDEDKTRFMTADKNKDGTLDAADFAAYLHPHNFDHMEDYELSRVMIQYDQNKDGYIDFQEYMGDAGAMNQEKLIVDRENFNEYDANKDGRLSKQEAKSWVMPNHRGGAEDEAEHLFSQTDLNRDGTLSKQEIIDQQLLWVGSAATNYGSHLHKIKHDPQEL